jgi:DNA invertase Pin-like site-specific DNA recombinase
MNCLKTENKPPKRLRHKRTLLSLRARLKAFFFHDNLRDYDMARIGYARVSTHDQTLDLQLDALEAAGCNRIFADKGISAIAKSRPGFAEAIDCLRSGDTLVLWKMDRAFRSLRHALDTLESFERQGVDFLVLTEGIDTTTPMGRCFFQIRNAFAELERSLISERTKAGMEAARKRGKRIGRPRVLSAAQISSARARRSAGEDMAVIAAQNGVSERTLYRAVNGC